MKTNSRISISNIVSIAIAIILMLSGQGIIGAAVAGFSVYALNIIYVSITQMTMTKDPYILGMAILGLVVNLMQYITDNAVFPAINPYYFNIALSILIIILRQFSETEKK
jgi:hypothetical protein